MISFTAMMGLEARADFEFHVTNRVGSSGALPIAPEMQKLDAGHALSVYGVEADDSLYPSLDPKQIRLIKLPGGPDRQSVGTGKGVAVTVDLGGGRVLKKKIKNK